MAATAGLSQLKGRDVLIDALRVPGAERTDEQLQPILEFVRGLRIFASFSTMHPDTLRLIASKLELHSYYTNSHIFTEGDRGHHFYIVLDGEVAIVRRRTVYAAAPGDVATETVVLVRLTCGKYFGENALESKEGLRTASAVATKRTRLLSLHADDYQSILSDFKAVVKVTARNFLKSPASIFNPLPPDSIEHLASFANVRTYSVNEEIVKAGIKCSNLMVIKSGMVKLIKAIPRSDMKQLAKRADYKIRHSNLDGSGFGSSFGGKKMSTRKLFAGSASASLTAGIGNASRSNAVAARPAAGAGSNASFVGSPTLLRAARSVIQQSAPSTSRTSDFSAGSTDSSIRQLLRESQDWRDEDEEEEDAKEEEGDGLPAGYWLLDDSNANDANHTTGFASAAGAGSCAGAYQAPGDRKSRRVSSCEELIAEAAAAIATAKGLSSFSEPVASDAETLLARVSQSVKTDRERLEVREAELMKRPSMISRNSASFEPLLLASAARAAGDDSVHSGYSRGHDNSNDDVSAHNSSMRSRRTQAATRHQAAASSAAVVAPAASSGFQRGVHHGPSKAGHGAAPKKTVPPAAASSDKVEFTVAVLLPGQVIGELTILDANMESPISAIASTAVEMYCFDQRILSDARIEDDTSIMNALRDDWKFRNPPVGEICKRARAKYEWAAQKQQIMKYYFGGKQR